MVPDILKRLTTQIWYFLGVPAFFIAFILLYAPFDSREILSAGGDFYSFNVTIVTCIILVTLVCTRVAFYFIWRSRDMSMNAYIGWCLAEVLVISLFTALFLCLMAKGVEPYFSVLSSALKLCLLVLVYPYLILTIVFLWQSREGRADAEAEDSLMRFVDENKRLKLTIASSAIVYIEAEENYVRIHYVEGERLRDYVLRNTMKGLEDLVCSHGMVRSHRSYYVNPQHIKVLRKDKEGQIVAEFDVQAPPVVVSKKYYDALSALL